MKFYVILFMSMASIFSASSSAHGVRDASNESQDINNTALTISFMDYLLSPVSAAVTMRVDERDGYRYISSDGLPNHQTGRFPNANNPHTMTAQEYRFRMKLHPKRGNQSTSIGHGYFGVAINGIPFDPATAEYWNNDRNSKWILDAINGGRDLGLDHNNAHVQPNGAYHYHSIPTALLNGSESQHKPVLLGYAADGFPIYSPYGHMDNDGNSRELKSSYRIKPGMRPDGPRGRYDGSYTLDYEYIPDQGDLDECNGRTSKTMEYPTGTYHYVITNQFPFVPRCWMGNPDQSFQRARPEPGNRQLPSDNRPEPAAREPGERGHQPPPEALAACRDKSSGSSCSVQTPHGSLDGICRERRDQFVCVPSNH